MEQFFRLCSKSTAVTEVIVAATVFFYLKVLKASTMLYRGGCNFGDEGDGPGSWCGTPTSAQDSIAGARD
ncbi:hypothetical protein P8452_65724 [Trifolium repens]|nr:hypothetical protein P8452_08079 [Trifolium repens]WJX26004.1 hypothetical protein P8452_14987 [Trifolium repens]WJX40130.1 hypothetical protein P8452_27636 [Trifolium repens]WJX83031.1 hypothetical protein P8452_65724 [Trifolium repens]